MVLGGMRLVQMSFEGCEGVCAFTGTSCRKDEIERTAGFFVRQKVIDQTETDSKAESATFLFSAFSKVSW